MTSRQQTPTGLSAPSKGEGTKESPRLRSCCSTSGGGAPPPSRGVDPRGEKGGDNDSGASIPPLGVKIEEASGPCSFGGRLRGDRGGPWRCRSVWRRRWWRARETRSCVFDWIHVCVCGICLCV